MAAGNARINPNAGINPNARIKPVAGINPNARIKPVAGINPNARIKPVAGINPNARIKPVERATNRSWDEWLVFMDGIGAKDLDHKQIALKVYYELEGAGVEPLGWWTQAVTVAYEQFIGRRIPGQRPDGTFQMSVSKSTRLGMQELMDAWTRFAAQDDFVSGLIAGDPKISGTERRITWRTKAGDGSSIIVTSEPKPNGTASIVATQIGLPGPEQNDEARANWAAAVARFLSR